MSALVVSLMQGPDLRDSDSVVKELQQVKLLLMAKESDHLIITESSKLLKAQVEDLKEQLSSRKCSEIGLEVEVLTLQSSLKKEERLRRRISVEIEQLESKLNDKTPSKDFLKAARSNGEEIWSSEKLACPSEASWNLTPVQNRVKHSQISDLDDTWAGVTI